MVALFPGKEARLKSACRFKSCRLRSIRSNKGYVMATVQELQNQLIEADQKAAELRVALDDALMAEPVEEEPKTLKRFRNVVNAYGTFVTEAYDMYEADEKARAMSRDEIIAAVDRWSDIEVNDSEFPEEC